MSGQKTFNERIAQINNHLRAKNKLVSKFYIDKLKLLNSIRKEATEAYMEQQNHITNCEAKLRSTLKGIGNDIRGHRVNQAGSNSSAALIECFTDDDGSNSDDHVVN